MLACWSAAKNLQNEPLPDFDLPAIQHADSMLPGVLTRPSLKILLCHHCLDKSQPNATHPYTCQPLSLPEAPSEISREHAAPFSD